MGTIELAAGFRVKLLRDADIGYQSEAMSRYRGILGVPLGPEPTPLRGLSLAMFAHLIDQRAVVADFAPSLEP